MNFRKYVMIAALVFASTTLLQAQSSNVTNAHFAYQAALEKIQVEDFSGAAAELGKAIAEIEPATTNEKTGVKEKTWRYRGMTYELVARHMDKPEFAALCADPVSLAAESYAKAMELDKKGSYDVENKRGLAVMQNLAMRAGIDKFNLEDYSAAYQMFTKAEELSLGMGVTDTLAIYNAALSAERAKDYENSLVYYQKAIDNGYGSAKGETAGLYSVMAGMIREKGDEAAADELVFSALEQFPTDKGLLIEAVNIYLGRGEDAKALEVLTKTIEQDPTNPNLQYSVGAVYDNLGKTTEARAAYVEAIALNADYFEPNYNLGASFYNEAVEMINGLDNIPTNKVTEYKNAKAKADETLRMAIPYLERAHALDDVDPGTMASLAECYARTGQLDKRKVIVTKLEATQK